MTGINNSSLHADVQFDVSVTQSANRTLCEQLLFGLSLTDSADSPVKGSRASILLLLARACIQQIAKYAQLCFSQGIHGT